MGLHHMHLCCNWYIFGRNLCWFAIEERLHTTHMALSQQTNCAMRFIHSGNHSHSAYIWGHRNSMWTLYTRGSRMWPWLEDVMMVHTICGLHLFRAPSVRIILHTQLRCIRANRMCDDRSKSEKLRARWVWTRCGGRRMWHRKHQLLNQASETRKGLVVLGSVSAVFF